MKTIGNVLWLVFGGLEAALQYFIGGCLLMLTIVGIPFGLQAWKIGFFILWPFGSKVVSTSEGNGCLNAAMNLIWICLLYTSPSPRDVEESRMPSSA